MKLYGQEKKLRKQIPLSEAGQAWISVRLHLVGKGLPLTWFINSTKVKTTPGLVISVYSVPGRTRA